MKLKPCAFCGSKNVGIGDVGCAFTVECWQKECRAMGPMAAYESVAETRGAGGRRLKALAAALWNKRAA